MNKNYKFRGFDWTELAYAFDLSITKNEDKLEEEIMRVLFDAVSWERRKEKTDEVFLLRKFLKKVADNCCFYSKPIWEGLCKVENDETLVKYFGLLIRCCWT